MPTTYIDQAYPNDPAGLPVPTDLTVITLTMIDEDDDGFIEPGDTVNGSTVTQVWENDTVTVDGVTITGVTFYTQDGGRYFTPNDGSVLVDGTATASTIVTVSTQMDVGDLGPPCFTRGTLIETDRGPKSVEDLQIGDLVQTLDDGLQPIRWIGSRSVRGSGKFAPVTFAESVLDNTRELVVSQQHRVMLSGAQAQLYFGQSEVLVAAKHLVNGNTIKITECAEVEYFHIMFDRHQIVLSEGIPTESFFFGSENRNLLDQDVRDELLALFPELDADGSDYGPTARYCLKAHEAHLLAVAAQ